jgi:acyl-coenzyme A thioesterase PaaI-like protein
MINPASIHCHCWACGQNAKGLNLRFHNIPSGVESEFVCDETFAGYPGFIQGGVVASILDSAMTHCLFAIGKTCVTADLSVRYRLPALTGQKSIVRASLVEEYNELSILKAQLIQDGVVKAHATGKFLPFKAAQTPSPPIASQNRLGQK